MNLKHRHAFMIFVTLNRPYDFQEDDLRLIFEVGKYRFEAVLLNDLLDILKNKYRYSKTFNSIFERV